MTLEQEFRKRAGETIENYLRILSGAFPNRQSLADTWKYEHEDGFMYWLIIDQLDGLIVGYFRGIYDRAPTLLLVGGNDEPVISMNQEAYDKLRLLKADEKSIVIVSGATHLFEEPGKLEQVAQLASEWFSCFVSRHRPREEAATMASIKEEGEKRRD